MYHKYIHRLHKEHIFNNNEIVYLDPRESFMDRTHQQSWRNNYGETLAVLELYGLLNYFHNQSSTNACLLIRIGCIPCKAFIISYL